MYLMIYMIGLMVRLGLISVSHDLKLKQSSDLCVSGSVCVSLEETESCVLLLPGEMLLFAVAPHRLLGDNLLHQLHDSRGVIIYSIYRLYSYIYCQNNVNTH